MTKDHEAVILSAARTPIGKFQGGLSGVPGPKLGAIGHFEFHRAEEAIEIGYQSCMRSASDIAAVANTATPAT